MRKDLDHIDAHARAFIGRSPLLVLSTADVHGWPDAPPRGDAPGFWRLMHRSKRRRYSITSSARPSNTRGTVMPSAFAVTMLM